MVEGFEYIILGGMVLVYVSVMFGFPGTEAEIISEDPYMENINADLTSFSYDSGEWELRHRPGWIYTGDSHLYSYSHVDRKMEDFVLGFPIIGEGPPLYHDAGVEQDLRLPLSGRLDIVAAGRNVNHLVYDELDPEGCTSSMYVVKATDRLTGKTYEINSFSAMDETVEVRNDIGFLRGRPVTIKMDIVPGGECGVWSGERGTIDYFYVERS